MMTAREVSLSSLVHLVRFTDFRSSYKGPYCRLEYPAMCRNSLGHHDTSLCVWTVFRTGSQTASFDAEMQPQRHSSGFDITSTTPHNVDCILAGTKQQYYRLGDGGLRNSHLKASVFKRSLIVYNDSDVQWPNKGLRHLTGQGVSQPFTLQHHRCLLQVMQILAA